MVNLSELRTTAKPFDFDIKIINVEIAIIRAELVQHISFPPSTKRTDVVPTGFWCRFDSHALGEAIIDYSQPDCELDLAFLYLFAIIEGKQDKKDKIVIR